MSHVHLRHLNPLPANLGEVLAAFKRVLVAELNRGQLDLLLRARYLVDTIKLGKMQGQPFFVREVLAAVEQAMEAPEA